ncbi:MAG TPA: hypothetical protein VM100_13905 [Longimicrobiales bacterium]|nr:hypothetical protein [Longimicrobiales bacterium]
MIRLLTRGVLLAALSATACDIPTGPPKWDSTFVVQSEGTTLSVSQLLPSSVTLANNGTSFALSLSPSTFSQSLGTLCGAPCTAVNGATAPKPSFTGAFNTTIALPADVVSAALTGGSLNLAVTNNFSFDPIRPSATARGSIAITVTSGTVTVGNSTISGTTQALPPGTTTQLQVPLTAGTIAGPLAVTLTVTSPAGDPTQINTASTLSVTATANNLQVSSASVRVQNRQVTATQVNFNVGDIDEFIVDHLKEGALILTINNPFGVTGNLPLTINANGTVVTKSVAIAAGTSTVEVSFTQSELRSILGKSNVTLRIGPGAVNSAANVTVTPNQVLSVSTKLRIVVGPEN